MAVVRWPSIPTWRRPIAIRIVVTADNHLGRHYDRMLPQRLEERREWLRRGLDTAVEYALDHQAHLFLQVGDLFNSTEPRNVEREFVAGALARLGNAGIRSIGITGNHDTPRVRSARRVATPQGSFARLGGLRLLDETTAGRDGAALTRDNTVDADTFEIDGVRVSVGGLAPDPTLPAGSDPLEGLEWRPRADIAILMLHGSLEGHIYPGAPEPVVRRHSVEALDGVNCVLVGHVHRYAAMRWGDKAVVVPGSTEWMTFGETGDQPGFVYMEMEPGGPVSLQHLEVDPQPRRQLAIETTRLDEDNPAEVLKAALEAVCRPDTMVRLSLRGPITRKRYHDLKLREVAEFGSARCFFLDLDTTNLYVEDELRLPEARGGKLSQREQLVMYAEESLAAAETESERELIGEATRAILEEYG